MSEGLIHIYYGNGKGKTSSAIGLLIRSLGWGRKVCLFQFLKPKRSKSGELNLLKELSNVKLFQYDQVHPIFWGRSEGKKMWRKLIREVKRALLDLEEEIVKGYDLLVLDEFLNLFDLGFVNKEYFTYLLEKKSPKTELVLTGRKLPKWLRRYGDYIVEFKSKKHPYERGMGARKGVEY